MRHRQSALQSIMSRPTHLRLDSKISPRAHAILTLPFFILGGSIMSLLGYGMGALSALTLGFPSPFEYGGAAGYDGAAVFAGMVGAAVAAVIIITYWLKDSALRVWMLTAYVCVWLVMTALQHYAILTTHSMVSAYVVAPIIIVGTITSILLMTGRAKK